MVYISSNSLLTSMRLSVMQSQQDLAKAQTELSSGTYADMGVSLGDKSGYLLSLTGQQSRLAAYTSGNTAASTRLSATDSALTSLQTAASSFLTTLTSVGTIGTSLTALQQTAKNNLASLISTLNTTVGGEAIFGGINTGVAPMAAYTASPASASKQAVDDAFSTAFGTSQSSSGASAVTAAQMSTFLGGSFAGLFDSASYKASWSSASDQVQSTEVSSSQTLNTSVSANDAVFRGLAQAYTMISEFTGSSTLSADAQQQVVQSAITAMGTALNGMTQMQAGVGLTENEISSANDRITAQTTVLSTATSDLTQVDPYTLDVRISSLQTQIEASYQLTNALQKMSLVNYLS